MKDALLKNPVRPQTASPSKKPEPIPARYTSKGAWYVDRVQLVGRDDVRKTFEKGRDIVRKSRATAE